MYIKDEYSSSTNTGPPPNNRGRPVERVHCGNARRQLLLWPNYGDELDTVPNHNFRFVHNLCTIYPCDRNSHCSSELCGGRLVGGGLSVCQGSN